jgi:hypothetical protein
MADPIKIRNSFSETIVGISGELTEVYGTTIMLYQDVTRVNYMIKFNSASTAKLEFTNSTYEEIIADTAVWIESTEISASVITTIDSPNGIRIKNTGAGSIYFAIRGNR